MHLFISVLGVYPHSTHAEDKAYCTLDGPSETKHTPGAETPSVVSCVYMRGHNPTQQSGLVARMHTDITQVAIHTLHKTDSRQS